VTSGEKVDYNLIGMEDSENLIYRRIQSLVNRFSSFTYDDQQDIVSLALARVLRELQSGKTPADLQSAYLTQLVQFAIKDFVRKKTRRSSQEIPLNDEILTLDDHDEVTLSEKEYQAIAKLSREDREFLEQLLLAARFNISDIELAKEIGIAPSTLSSRKISIIRRLREQL
jgi:DNA-directed RNA polymerase specialized sigma24 family protein